MNKGIQVNKSLKASGIYYIRTDGNSNTPCIDIIEGEDAYTVTLDKLLEMFEDCEVEIKVSAVGGLDD